MGKHAFSTRLFEVKLEEVCHMKKPRKVDILIVFTIKNGLLAIALVNVLLGIIKPWSPNMAGERVQRKVQEAKLYDEHQRAWVSARLVSIGREESVSLTNRIDDVRTPRTGLASCCTTDELMNELMITSVYLQASFPINEYLSI